MTLLEHIQRTLRELGKNEQHIRWVGSQDGVFRITWETFAVLAVEIEFTRQRMNDIVAPDLVIVGDFWWLQPAETDGVQQFRLYQMPRLKGSPLPVSTIMTTRGTPMSLRRLNQQGY